MLDYEKERLEYIINKEKELSTKEVKINDMQNCVSELNRYKKSIEHIKNVIAENISKFAISENNFPANNVNTENINVNNNIPLMDINEQRKLLAEYLNTTSENNNNAANVKTENVKTENVKTENVKTENVRTENVRK
jgi:hypothetical protein